MSEEEDNPIWDTVIFLLLIVIIISFVSPFVWSQMNGAAKWSDFYAKEIVKSVDLAEPGDKIELDVHHATKIAQRNKKLDFQQIFSFNETTNEACVSLSSEAKTCYHYFNDIGVNEVAVIAGAYRESGKNTLIFYITEKKEVEP